MVFLSTLFLSFLFFSSFISRSASAQATDHDRAHTHFEQGRHHVKEGRCDLAIEEFRTSIDFEPNVGARLNLGDCYVALGRLPEGWRQFKEAETLAARLADARLDEARRSAATTESKLVRVIVREPEPSIEGLALTVDGVSAGARPWLVAVPPGTHVIEASTPSGQHWRESFSGRAGDSVRLFVVFTAPTPTPTTPTPTPTPTAPAPIKGDDNKDSDAKSTLRTVGYVAGGVGIAALATGAVFGAITLSERAHLADAIRRDPRCTGGYPNGSCDPAARDAIQPIEDRAFFASTMASIGILSGAVLLAGGVVLVVFVAPKKDSTMTRTRVGASPEVRVRASSSMVLLEGTF